MKKILNRELNEIVQFLRTRCQDDKRVTDCADDFEQIVIATSRQKKNFAEVSDADMIVIETIRSIPTYKVEKEVTTMITTQRREFCRNKRIAQNGYKYNIRNRIRDIIGEELF